jgi:hypothetical protein
VSLLVEAICWRLAKKMGESMCITIYHTYLFVRAPTSNTGENRVENSKIFEIYCLSTKTKSDEVLTELYRGIAASPSYSIIGLPHQGKQG